MDIDTIPFGVDFRDHIQEAVSRCNVFLAVIGQHWIGVQDDGSSRILDPTDFVRIEVETALSRDIPIIPVLIGDASIPSIEELPDSLADFPYKNAANVDLGRDFNVHMNRIVERLDELLGETAPTLTSCPLSVSMWSSRESFYFHSVGVKRDLIATVFVLWVEIINRSRDPVTILEALWICADNRLPNRAKPSKNMPYSNVTYPRRNLQNEGGPYLEFDKTNAAFAFKPYIEDVNLEMAGGSSRIGSLIFWLLPADTSFSGPIEGKLIVRTSRGDTELPVEIQQRGV